MIIFVAIRAIEMLCSYLHQDRLDFLHGIYLLVGVKTTTKSPKKLKYE